MGVTAIEAARWVYGGRGMQPEPAEHRRLARYRTGVDALPTVVNARVSGVRTPDQALRAVGDTDDPLAGIGPAVGDRVRFAPPGLAPVDGVVDIVNPDAVGIRTDDALYRFIRGFFGPLFAQHHTFRPDINPEQIGQAWRDWLTQVPG